MRTSTTRYRATLERVLRAVVKVLVVSDAPDHEQPWQTKGPEPSSGSGVIIETARGLRVLTSAHVVENQAFIEVRRYGLARKVVATVESVGHECDLAVLQVADETFMAGTIPVGLGGLPRLGREVLVCGFPIGGERLSITEGVVSRIEISAYAQSQRELLAIQIDAAINDGNSGGPVLEGGQLVGIAFQALEGGENIGYAIPVPVIEHYLADVSDDTYHGFPDLGIYTQPTESPALRGYLGLPADRGGVLVTAVNHGGSGWKVLRRGDVLLAIDGVELEADGTVPFRDQEQIEHTFLVSSRQVGEHLPLTVWRGGSRLDLEVRLRPPRLLVPEARFDVRPTYFVHGGLLFAPLSLDYLRTWGEDWQQSAPSRLTALYLNGIRTRTRQEVVMLQKVLPDAVNQGYHGLGNLIVRRVEGRGVRHMRELVQLIDEARGEHLRIECDSGEQVVLDRQQVARRHQAILQRFGVPADRSADLPPPPATGDPS